MNTKYKSRTTTNVVEVSDLRSAGMCKRTLGYTFVIYKFEDENYEFSRIMEHREFHKKYEEIK